MYKINSLWYSPEPPTGFFSERLEEKIDTYYQLRYREYMYRNLPHKRIMIDIGASIGIFARPCAQHFEQVICFEPNPMVYPVLEKNLESCGNVLMFNTGISAQTQRVEFQMDPMQCGISYQIGSRDRVADWPTVECQLETLDIYGFQRVDWIKIDVEGYELDVLEGSRLTISRNRPWLLLEDNGNTEQHRQFLNDLCGPYRRAEDLKSKTNSVWIPQ